jgi:hypothetical protein
VPQQEEGAHHQARVGERAARDAELQPQAGQAVRVILIQIRFVVDPDPSLNN